MDIILEVHVLDAEANVDEEFPDHLLGDHFAVVLFD